MKTTTTVLLLLCLAPLAPAAPYRAEARPAALDDAPTARDVLYRYAQLVKLPQRVEKTSALRSSGTVTISGLELQGRFERLAAKPDKSLLRIELASVGTILVGHGDGVGWTVHPLLGPRVLDGVEALQSSLQADYEGVLKPTSKYESIRTTGREAFGGEPCWKIELVAKVPEGMEREETKRARTTVEYYSTESGLLRGQRSVTPGPAGEVEATVVLSDYGEVDGTLVARRTLQRAMGTELVLVVEKLEYDPELPEDAFEPPAAIRALLTERAAEAESERDPR